ncbi:MAG: PEP-CTERM sorting domain-containing protein, partial [Fimbriimonadaceae bacterium]
PVQQTRNSKEENSMKKSNIVGLAFIVSCLAPGLASANLLLNGNLDKTYQQEIVPGFFLPKPDMWINDGFKSASGAYEDEMSSEPWAGPAPTPVTTDGVASDDWAVFFKPFSGSANDLATGHLRQSVAGTAGSTYTFSGWAGGETNAMMQDAVFAIDYFTAGNVLISSTILSILPTLTTANGQAFNYKLYSVSSIAPTNTAFVQGRVSMINAMANPLGGGQAFVVDDFNLAADSVPEPATMTILALGAFAALRRRKK